jgi:hypothetical protein
MEKYYSLRVVWAGKAVIDVIGVLIFWLFGIIDILALLHKDRHM